MAAISVIIILFLFLVLLASLGLIMSLCDYYNYVDEDLPKLKFKYFKSYYNLNKLSWNLEEYTVAKAGVEFRFSYFDYYKYKNFLKQKEKAEKTINNNQKLLALTNAVQQDIDNLRKQANKEIEHGVKQSIDIQKRLEEDIKLKC